MKLHIDRNRLRSLVSQEDDLAVTAGAKLELPAPVRTILDDIPIEAFPIEEILRRGWIQGERQEVMRERQTYVSAFFSQLITARAQAALLRHTVRAEQEFTAEVRYKAGMLLWLARVDLRSQQEFPELLDVDFNLDRSFLREVAALSRYENGPTLVVGTLREKGIAFLVERHLPHTRLDGAAMWNSNGAPLIAMTLRHDRLDNFWFTLLHELAHVVLHLQRNRDQSFVDDLDQIADDELEREANVVAADALLPRQIWNRSDVRRRPTKAGIFRFAERVGVHPAIVAGRIQKERHRFDIFRDIVDVSQVRNFFADARNT